MSAYCTVTECFYLCPCPVHDVEPPPAYDADISLEAANVVIPDAQPSGCPPPYQVDNVVNRYCPLEADVKEESQHEHS